MSHVFSPGSSFSYSLNICAARLLLPIVGVVITYDINYLVSNYDRFNRFIVSLTNILTAFVISSRLLRILLMRTRAIFIVSACWGGYDRLIFGWFVKRGYNAASFGFYRHKTDYC